MTDIVAPTPAQTAAVRDPAEVVLSGEIRDLMRKQAEYDRLEDFHRSAMINAQLEQMKAQAQIDRLMEALRLVKFGSMA